jgi:hypothetical protein
LFLVVDVGVCVVATFDPVDTAVAIDPSDIFFSFFYFYDYLFVKIILLYRSLDLISIIK